MSSQGVISSHSIYQSSEMKRVICLLRVYLGIARQLSWKMLQEEKG
jgi:hypothetical protein